MLRGVLSRELLLDRVWATRGEEIESGP